MTAFQQKTGTPYNERTAMSTNTTFDLDQIKPISSRLSDAENRLRLRLMKQIIDLGHPVAAPETSDTRDVTPTDIFENLVKKQVIILDEQQRAQYVYPVSAAPTAHRVKLADGRSFHAMCAIDAMGSTFTLQQDITIHSRCSLCSTPISLNIHNGQLDRLQPPTTHVLHVDLEKSRDWADTC
ncbi:MAG: hypothetical protein C0618_05295 [Desulfuromonas sp.]|nr:MAG: hypothetical protein C0618_05295 [Desulfuromonas sp.]